MVLYVGKKLYVIQILESFYVEIIIFPVIFDGQTLPVRVIQLKGGRSWLKKEYIHDKIVSDATITVGGWPSTEGLDPPIT